MFEKLSDPKDVILREGHVVIPQPESQIAVGDEILAIATPEVEDILRQALVGPTEGQAAS